MKSYTSPQITAAAAQHHAHCYLFEIDFPTGVQRFTTAGATLPASFYDPGTLSQSWIGGVSPTMVEALRDTESDEAVGIKFRLSGLSSSQINMALTYPVQGRRVTVYVAVLDTASQYALVGTPILDHEYMLDVVYPEDRDGVRELVVEAESEEARFLRSNEWRYTDQNHRSRYPDDTICRFTSQEQQSVIWGQG